jgi:hypothetical protein
MPERTSDETEALLKEGCRRLLRDKKNGIKINIAQTDGLPPSHVASSTLDHTQLSSTFQLNSQ